MVVFKPIPNYNGYYINESGNILDNNQKLIRFATDNDCRLYSIIENNIEYIDELVAKTFLNNPDNFKFVGHRDEDILNCHVSNLYWVNEPEYKNYQNYRLKSSYNKNHNTSKFIYQIYNDDESIVIDCFGRDEVAKITQYEVMGLKNIIGRRKISLGPYKGFMIRNTHKLVK